VTDPEGAVDGYSTTHPLVEVAVNFRRTLIAAIVLGGVSLLACSLLTSYAAGLLICVGLALGAYNARMVARGAARAATGGRGYRRRRFVGSALGRLGVITAIALLLLIAVHPGGWGVVVGLALFQLLLVGMAAGPLLREVRRT
jgi:hypothetical protein